MGFRCIAGVPQREDMHQWKDLAKGTPLRGTASCGRFPRAHASLPPEATRQGHPDATFPYPHGTHVASIAQSHANHHPSVRITPETLSRGTLCIR
jgi:hypothetical protein